MVKVCRAKNYFSRLEAAARPALGQLAVSLGHTLEPPVPSLFTFHVVTRGCTNSPAFQ